MVGTHVCKVEYNKVNISGDTSTLSATALVSGIMNAQVTTKTGKNADSFIIKLVDIKEGVEDYYFNLMESGDFITIYSSTDGGTTWVPEINGLIKQKVKSFSPSNKTLVVSGLNRLESLLGLITPVASFPGQQKGADFWIRLIIREMNTQNDFASYFGKISNGEPANKTIKRPEKYIYGGLLSEWNAVSNDVISDTNLFVTSDFYRGDQISFELIETLSSENYAGTSHTYYIDTNNYFRWLPFSTTVTGNLPVDDIKTSITKQEYDIVNYVIISAGKNLYDNASINTFKYDLLSATANGIKAKVVYMNRMNSLVMNELRLKLKSDGYYDDDTFPFSTAYPFQTPSNWGYSTSVDSDAELNAEFVDEVVRRSNDYAIEYLALRVSPSYKEKYTIPDEEDQQTNYLLTGYYTDTYINRNLRVVQRSKTFIPKSGWECDIDLEEDYDKV